MASRDIFIVEPSNEEQKEALMAFIRALKIKFEITHADSESKDTVLENLKKGFSELKLIKEGHLKGTPAKEFLDGL